MGGVVAALGVVWFFALIILAILAILMPVFVYQLRNAAREAASELRSINAQLAHVSDQLGAAQQVLYQSRGELR